MSMNIESKILYSKFYNNIIILNFINNKTIIYINKINIVFSGYIISITLTSV